ncbi:MAG: long-chain fatty acid--CoA ligase [Desulfobulbaceae bacterium]|nr:long-chain fatty acid--CoA ligase [Desulfobulbaceae bacterium]
MNSDINNTTAVATANLPVVRADATTINDLVDLSCAQFGPQPAIGLALEAPISYSGLREHIFALAQRLRQAGVCRGSRVAILGENSHYWAIAYLAAVRLGASVVPIFPETPVADVHHILGQASCDTLFITRRQLEKIYDLKKPLSTLITLDDSQDSTGLLAPIPFTTFLQEGIELQQEKQEQEPFPEIKPDELASILYTSGTSGFSKAVMLSHANLCANAHATGRLIQLTPGTVFVSVLPLSHAYEFTVGFLMPMIRGCRIAYAAKTPTPAVLQRICAHEQPQVMLVVPLIMEKIYKKRIAAQLEKSKVMGFVCRLGMARRLFFRKAGAKLMEFFGGRLQVLGIGGAALNPDVERFLREAELPFLVGYGLTEASPLLSGGPFGDSTIAPGSAGKAAPGVELRIEDPDPETGIGEIWARGANIMQGYMNDPEATLEALSTDGWLRTGDLGRLDAVGNLFISGRSKSVIVLSSGENIYPEAIEHKLNAFPFVMESLVVENNGLLEALIYPDYEYLDSKTRGQTMAMRQEYLNRLLGEMRRDVNEALAISSRISRVVERPEPFVKTATHKIKRFLY